MDVFYALAEPRRRKIIEIIANNGRLSATEVCENFKVTPQAISQHLRVLLDAKILRVEKHAQQRIYEINPGSIVELEQWLAHTKKLWNDRLDSLDKFLETEKKKKY